MTYSELQSDRQHFGAAALLPGSSTATSNQRRTMLPRNKTGVRVPVTWQYFLERTTLTDEGCLVWNGMLMHNKWPRMATAETGVQLAHRVAYSIYHTGKWDSLTSEDILVPKCQHPQCIHPLHWGKKPKSYEPRAVYDRARRRRLRGPAK